MRRLNEYGLTPQQETFVNEYIKTGNGYRSYIKAYPKAEKWTKNAVYVQTNKILNNSKVNLRIKAYNDEIAKSTQESIKLNKRRILNEIIELQQSCKNDGAGQNTTQLQALKLLSQIAGLLQENKTEINITNNNQTVNEVIGYLDL